MVNFEARRIERAKVQDGRDRLERIHGATLDAMQPADRDRFAENVFGSHVAAELGRQHAPILYRAGLLAALAAGDP